MLIVQLMPGELLTLQSIGGGARVTQEADNVLLLQVTEGSTPAAARKAIQVSHIQSLRSRDTFRVLLLTVSFSADILRSDVDNL